MSLKLSASAPHEVLVRILNGVLFELAQQVRQQAGHKPLRMMKRRRPS